MLTLTLLFAYLTAFTAVLGAMPIPLEQRPTLDAFGFTQPKNKISLWSIVRKIALINRPLCAGAIRKRLTKDLAMARLDMMPEEFMVVKEVALVVIALISFPTITADLVIMWVVMCIVAAHILPEFWLKSRVRKVKDTIVKELPDAIDLLGLCVNAGLDFMLSLKWVVEKSPPSVMMEELNVILQDINVGKTRRDAIKDLAMKYELPDLSTFARTLIQADKMGTSMTEALNMLSEDMRLARYRRGEQLALKAPLKLLIPLLLFIFPVVGILVAGPIMLDFIENNPFKSLGR